MNASPGSLSGDVRVVRQAELDDGLDGGLALQRLAEATHLPTGIASGQVEVVEVPVAGGAVTRVEPGTDILLHLVAGHLRVQWGPALHREIRAQPGDTLLVPAGVTFRAINASEFLSLQFILVRGG